MLLLRLQGIHDMKGSYEQPSLTFEDTGRFVAIAVVFGLTILASLLAGGLSLRVRHPIWASVWVAILWLFVAILMLLGVGLLKGVYVVGKDTCLYAETFVTRYANTKVTDPTKKAFVSDLWKKFIDNVPVLGHELACCIAGRAALLGGGCQYHAERLTLLFLLFLQLNRALTFYFNQNLPLQQPQGTAISAVTGIDLQPVYNLLQVRFMRRMQEASTKAFLLYA